MNTSQKAHVRPRTMRSVMRLLLVAAMLATTMAIVSTPTSAANSTLVVFDDMEHADPFGNGWFSFGSDTGGGGITANTVDVPPGGGVTTTSPMVPLPVIVTASPPLFRSRRPEPVRPLTVPPIV